LWENDYNKKPQQIHYSLLLVFSVNLLINCTGS